MAYAGRNQSWDRIHFLRFSILQFGQVSVWQSVTLLPISCKSVQPVPARVEEPVSLVRQSSSGGATNNPPFAISQHGKVGCQNWHPYASAYSAAGGEDD